MVGAAPVRQPTEATTRSVTLVVVAVPEPTAVVLPPVADPVASTAEADAMPPVQARSPRVGPFAVATGQVAMDRTAVVSLARTSPGSTRLNEPTSTSAARMPTRRDRKVSRDAALDEPATPLTR